MSTNVPKFTLRINPMLVKKLGYIAEYNGRSINKEIEQLVKAHIADYEKRNGEIKD